MTLKHLIIGVLFLLATDFASDWYLDHQQQMERE